MAKPTKTPRPNPRPKPTNPRAAQSSALQRLSAPVLLRLHGWPRWVFPIFTALLLVGGLLVPNAVLAAVLLTLLTLILAWLVALSWPVISPLARLIRILVLGALVMVVIGRARGQM